MNFNFYSEANFGRRGICMRGWTCQDDKMRHVSLEIWPDDSWKYITQSVTQRRLGRGLPGGSESSTKTELSWYKDALLVKDKEAGTGGPHSPDEEPVTFPKMVTKNHWIEILIVRVVRESRKSPETWWFHCSLMWMKLTTPLQRNTVSTLWWHVSPLAGCPHLEGKKLRHPQTSLKCGCASTTCPENDKRWTPVRTQTRDLPQEFLWCLACMSVCGLMGWRVCAWGGWGGTALLDLLIAGKCPTFFKPLSVFLCCGWMRSPTDVSHWRHHVGLYFGVFVDFQAEARSPRMKGCVYRETIL